MTTRHHGETESRAEGFDGRIEDAFEWLRIHGRPAAIIATLLLVGGGGSALFFEWNQTQELAAQQEWSAVERAFITAMGGAQGSVAVPEPANPEQATTAREEALAGYDEVIASQSGRLAATLADLRAAEIQIDLGRLGKAEQRLAALAARLDSDHLLRPTALRLRGFALEQQRRFGEAALAYGEAGATENYYDRGATWLLAAMSYGAAGDRDGELSAYQEVLAVDPVLAEQQRVNDRLRTLGSAGPNQAPAE